MSAPPATALVVGGAGGIGSAVARQLAAAAWVRRLVVADLDERRAGELAVELSSPACETVGMGVDVTDADSRGHLLKVTPRLGALALCVGSFDQGDDGTERLRELAEVNFVGPYSLARACGETMAAGGGGAIVGVGSIAAQVARPGQAAYAGSKAAFAAALSVLGLELAAAGVRINTVTPGPTATAMNAKFSTASASIDLVDGDLDSYRVGIPLGKLGTASEVAAAVVFLLSPAASQIALADLRVDGGQLLGS